MKQSTENFLRRLIKEEIAKAKSLSYSLREDIDDDQLEQIDFKIYNSGNKTAMLSWERKIRSILRNISALPKTWQGKGRDHDFVWKKISELSLAHKRDIQEWGYDIMQRFGIK